MLRDFEPHDDLLRPFRQTADIWAACRAALNDWYDVPASKSQLDPRFASLVESHALADDVVELLRVLSELDGAGRLGALQLELGVREFPAVEGLVVCHDTDDPDVHFGVRTSDPSVPPSIYSFDTEGIDPDAPDAEPDREPSTDSPGAFLLACILRGLEIPGSLALSGFAEEEEDFDRIATRDLGPPVRLGEVRLFGTPGLLLIRWGPSHLGAQVDLSILSRHAAQPVSEELLGELGFGLRAVDTHPWA